MGATGERPTNNVSKPLFIVCSVSLCSTLMFIVLAIMFHMFQCLLQWYSLRFGDHIWISQAHRVEQEPHHAGRNHRHRTGKGQ